MFEALSGRFGEIFNRLGRHGVLSEAQIVDALREVRVALLEADVALSVVNDFIASVQENALGERVLNSVTPAQMVIKIVHERLIDALGSTTEGLNLNSPPPIVMLFVGLQGSGKTTTTAKIGKFLYEKNKRKVLMASLDVRRPAAQEQLRVLGDQILIPTLDVVKGEAPVAIARRAIGKARREGYDVVLLDSAGRLTIDDEMMQEVVALSETAKPVETLLVADALTGQDAVSLARGFNARLQLTGIVLTRVDGDARGGAALSMRAATGCPIKLLGVGEKLDALEPFDGERIANRILGMGDVVGLVERAAEVIEQRDAEKLAAKLEKGNFDLNDLAQQLRQLNKMGGLSDVMSMLPDFGKMKNRHDAEHLDSRLLRRQEAIILSMTPGERRQPRILKASRKRRIAAGSGATVQDVNKLLKQHKQMQTMMKRMGQFGRKGRNVVGGFPGAVSGMLSGDQR